jgi:hypothetical protein
MNNFFSSLFFQSPAFPPGVFGKVKIDRKTARRRLMEEWTEQQQYLEYKRKLEGNNNAMVLLIATGV